MPNPSVEMLMKKIEQKSERRIAKSRPKMAVSGAGVKHLARIIQKKSKKI